MFLLAGWYTLLDGTAEALDLLERGVRERAPFMTYLGGVGLRGLDDEPRYRALRAEVGLP